MTWMLLCTLAVVLALALAASWHRHTELVRQAAVVQERRQASSRELSAAPLQVPVIDLSRCLGCGTCVKSCPEDGVLQLVHGQAAVVNAASCVGHAHCVAECPVGAVTLSRGDLSQRDDVPVLDEALQAVGMPGVFLAGEITARALIRTAIVQGSAVAEQVLSRCAVTTAGGDDEVLDAVVVGAGPGGIACALGLTAGGANFVLIDQEPIVGGTVAKYPRRKLVLTQPVDLPLHGRMREREYAKEELVELWQGIADRHALPFVGGVTFEHIEREDDDVLVVHTSAGVYRARSVVLAIGRRGMPRRLGVAGEDLPNVAYSLIDAAAYAGRRALVVGGGDSAVEAALALAEQPGTEVTIAYRQDAFVRLRSKNKQRITAQIAAGRVRACMSTQVAAIHADRVELRVAGAKQELPVDDVFVMIGGEPPFGPLQRSGISFDHSHQDEAALAAANAPVAAPQSRGAELLPALVWGLAMTVAALAFLVWHHDYYGLSAAERAMDPKHALLSADRGLGLWFGIASAGAILVNLAYLARRQMWLGLRLGALPTWLNVHVATGVLALLLAMQHGAMAPRQTPGGFAFWGLLVLLVTGAIGRWFYAWLPRAANGRELELDKVRAELDALHRAEGSSEFTRHAAASIDALVERRQWRSTWVGRVFALVGLQLDLWWTLRKLRRAAAAAAVDAGEFAAFAAQARSAHGAAIAVAHLEDLRALLGSWRWLHRWLAILVVLLVVIHVVVATLHGAFSGGGL
ncbi:MAG: NAD(P)-binding domain-containing protein [Planctomycetes bacterium]|nr:NAD(P)-binding domain-containing protein [Planctomycetota bacterium]MCB9883994.1 NAD(P)-binding domain-containing protein [Planctomycetota bacterium]